MTKTRILFLALSVACSCSAGIRKDLQEHFIPFHAAMLSGAVKDTLKQAGELHRRSRVTTRR